MGNTVNIPSVPAYVFEYLQSLLASNYTAARWKLDFERTSQRKGRLIITVRSRIHEEFVPLIDDLKDQMLASFVPQLKHRVFWRTRTTEVKTDYDVMVPDGGLSFYKPDSTFLVLEVAHSQTEKAVRHKAQRYIQETNQQVRIVVIVVVNKRPTPKGQTAAPVSLSAETDTVHVLVCLSLIHI